METVTIDATKAREKFHRFIDEIEDERVIGLYAAFSNEIEDEDWEYPEELKVQLDKDFEDYKNGAATFSREDVRNEIKARLNSEK